VGGSKVDNFALLELVDLGEGFGDGEEMAVKLGVSALDEFPQGVEFGFGGGVGVEEGLGLTEVVDELF